VTERANDSSLKTPRARGLSVVVTEVGVWKTVRLKRKREQVVGAYEEVHATWEHLSRDAHIGMSDAFQIVSAVANSDDGRRALAEILGHAENVAIIEPDALSYLRVSRDLPLPPGVEDHRADAYFRTRFYTGTRQSKTHGVQNPREFLYFNYAIVMVLGTLDDVSAVREELRGSGYDPVIVRMPDGRQRAIGTVMINEFRDSTFGPYNEVIFFVTAIPADSSENVKTIEHVNAFSLQTPMDRGATAYLLKLWLDELSPIDGGNDYLGTNKELGCFRFEDKSDGSREFRSWDKELKGLVSGAVPRTVTADVADAVKAAYRAAAERSGTVVPTSTVQTIPVASRPDEDVGKPASKWVIAVDWRRTVLQAVTQRQIRLTFGESEWGRRFERLGFTPALSFYSPSGVGQLLQHIGDCPYNPAGLSA
jgi:hypothetical protein